MRCPRAWAEQYLRGVREPDVPWEALAGHVYDQRSKLWLAPSGGVKGKFKGLSASASELAVRGPVTTRRRSTALGKAMHSHLESWYRGAEPAWDSYPAHVALAGLAHLPHPSRTWAECEAPIGNVPLPPLGDGKPTVALAVHGVLWAGLVDLTAFAPDEWRRLGVTAPHGLGVIDYKSTASISQYAPTPAALRDAIQANLYGAATCQRFGLTRVPERFVYFETKLVRKAAAVDTTIELSRALDVLGPCAELARDLDRIATPEDAPQNTSACNAYGPPDKVNCPHHTSNGGTCPAQARSQFAQVRARKSSIMAIDPKVAERFAAIQTKGAAAPVAPAPAPEPEPEQIEATASVAANVVAPVQTTRIPVGAGKRTKAGPAALGTGAAADVLTLATKLADAQSAAVEANAVVAGVLAEIKAACG